MNAIIRLVASLFLLSGTAMAQTVEIPGPNGPLQAEMIAVEGAEHIVIIIPGSGPTDRDGNSPNLGLQSDTYKLLAQGLSENGITTIRIDKRGFYGSSSAISDPNDVTIEAYADDAGNWVQYAADLANCVWLAGHSEGGLVAMAASEQTSDELCGLVLLATPGRPIGQLLVEQLEANPANASLMPEITDIVADLEAGKRRDEGTITPILRPLFSEGLQRFMIDLFSYDPVVVAERLAGPALIVQGDEDIQVRTKDADLLQAALSNADRLDLEGATHMLKLSVKGQPFATYTDPSLPLHDALISGIVDFLGKSHVSKKK